MARDFRAGGEQDLAALRAKRVDAENRLRSPVDWAAEKLREFQDGPDIPRPNMAQTFIPVIGPAWEAAGDLQDGDYGGALFNGTMAVTDALPVGVAFKGLNAARKGVKVLKEGSLTANAAQKMYRRRLGITGRKTEVHHAVPLNGTPRNVQDWRNHFSFLKALPIEQHRRLTGSYGPKPRYDPIRRAWFGTTDWMKAVPTGIAGYTADSVQNVVRPSSPGILGPTDERRR